MLRRGSASPPSTASSARSAKPTCSSATPTTCRSGWPAIMGGADTEITDATTTVALEMRLVRAVRHRRHGGADRPAQRRVGAVRARRRPLRHRPRRRPLRRAARRDVPRPGRARRRGRCAHGSPPGRAERAAPCASPTSTASSAPTSTAGDLARLLDPIGYTVDGAGDGVVDVALPSWRPDSTEEIDVIEEVGRHYGYANIVKRVPRSPLHGHLSERQQRRRRLRQVLVGLGASEVMPSPFLSADAAGGAGLDGALLHITNPLVADEDVLRPSLRPGLLRAVAFNESHRRPGVWLFEIGHVYRPGPGELPDEREVLGLVLAGEEAPAAMAAWREIAAAMVDRRAGRPDRRAGRAARRPARPRCVAGRERIGAVGEIAPDGARGVRHRRAGGGARDRPRRRPWRTSPSRHGGSRPVATRRAISTWRSCCPTTSRPSGSTRRSARGPATCSSASCRSTATAGRACPRARRSLAYRLRLQAPDRTLTDADVGDGA